MDETIRCCVCGQPDIRMQADPRDARILALESALREACAMGLALLVDVESAESAQMPYTRHMFARLRAVADGREEG